jgi:TonB family protein
MSSILVVGQEQRSLEQIHQALSADGWRVRLVQGRVQALQAAASEAPDLVLVSAEVPGAEALAKSFSRGAGGPGVVLLMPERPGGGRSIQADGRLNRPFSDDDVLEVVRRVQAVPRQTQAAAPAQAQVRLTSQEIFGDVLAEVEGLPRSTPQPASPAASGRASLAANGGASQGQVPPGDSSGIPAPQGGGAHRAPGGADDEIQRKLEKTLSGVFGPSRAPGAPVSSPAAADSAAKADATAEIEALLSKTLSKLDLPTRHRPAAAPPTPHPAPAAAGPAPGPAPAASPVPPPASAPAPGAPEQASTAALPMSSTAAAPASSAAASPPAPTAASPQVSRGAAPAAAAQAAGSAASSATAAAAAPPPAEEGSGVHRLRGSGQVDLSEIEDLARTRRKSAPGRPAGPAAPSGASPAAARRSALAPAASAPDASPAQAATAPFDGAATQRIQVPREEGGDQPGERFGQYTLLERIAVGGMAEVWKARMRGVEGFQKTVAIKKILPHMTDNTEFVAMFIDEAKLAAQLSHPNIIHIYDLGKIGRDYYIAMEYVEGKDLRSLLNAGRRAAAPLPLGLALLIATRLAGALDYAHHKRDFEGRELGLVHRDVSPQNVLLSFDGDVKLCDFGIAKAVSKASQTQLGALKGKLQYMSPEQAWGRHVDARSDIFSLGAVLFEMLTGERLFPGDTEMSVLEAVRQAKVRTPRQVDQSVPPEVDEIVGRALATQPEDRFQNAGEMAQRLEAVLHARKPLPGPADLAAYIRTAAQAAPGTQEAREAPAAAERGSRPSFAPPLAASPAAAAPARRKTPPPSAPPATPPAPPTSYPAAAPASLGATGSSPGFKPAPALADAAVAGAAVPPLAPLAEVPVEEHRGRRLLIAAIVLLAVVAVASFFVFGRRKTATPAAPASAAGLGTAGAATPAGQNPGAPVPANPGTAPSTAGSANGKAGAPAAIASSTGVPARPGAAGTPAGGKVDVQGLVGQEVAKRAEAMKQKLEEQQKQLQRQLDQAKATAKTPSETTGRPPVEPARSAAAPPPTSPSAAPEPREEPARPATGAAAVQQTAAAQQQASAGQQAAPSPASAPPPAAGAPNGAETGKTVPAAEAPRAASVTKPGDMVSMGPGVTPPKLVSVSKPEYPPLARIQRVEGVVIVNVLVDESGRVTDTHLLEPIKERVGINEAALAVARSARYTPASKEGVRVKMWARLKIPFKL